MQYTENWEEFWWTKITGAQTVVNKVTMALLENKMVVLKVPSNLPWRRTMRSSVQGLFIERNDSDILIDYIDLSDDNPEDIEPGRFVLNRYSGSSVKNGYREKSGLTLQQYITKHNVINNRIIWIKGFTPKTADKWIKFCRGFSPKSAEDGLFVLEIHDAILQAESKYIECIDFDKCVSSYDVQLFNSFVLDDQNVYPNNWKRYISTVLASVCDVDAEVSETLIRSVNFRFESPIEGIKQIVEMSDFVKRGTEDDSNHILCHYRNNNISEINHRIWKAQVQVLFPIIEIERLKIIEKWSAEIGGALNNNKVFQYGNQISDPIEVEFGTLCYMMGYRMSVNQYMLYIPNDNDRDWIRFLHECRNKLAHASLCTPDETAKILDNCE